MSQSQHHSHHHHGHHHHHHHYGEGSKNLALAFFLNLIFAIIEFVGGILTNSVAIMSDAVHDFVDAMAIGFAYWMERKSTKKGNSQYTYGFRRLSVVAALVTALLLMGGTVAILAKAIPRLLNPVTPEAGGMIGLALLGLAVNGFAAWKTSHGNSLNERVITWHLIEDVMGWALVLVGAIVMSIWDLPIIDPLLAIILSLWVLKNVYGVFKETLQVFLQGTPDGIDVAHVEKHILQVPGVLGVHHTHMWSLDGQKHILTTHLVLGVYELEKAHAIKNEVKKMLQEEFGIAEATLELECQNESCEMPEH